MAAAVPVKLMNGQKSSSRSIRRHDGGNGVFRGQGAATDPAGAEIAGELVFLEIPANAVPEPFIFQACGWQTFRLCGPELILDEGGAILFEIIRNCAEITSISREARFPRMPDFCW